MALCIAQSHSLSFALAVFAVLEPDVVPRRRHGLLEPSVHPSLVVLGVGPAPCIGLAQGVQLEQQLCLIAMHGGHAVSFAILPSRRPLESFQHGRRLGGQAVDGHGRSRL